MSRNEITTSPRMTGRAAPYVPELTAMGPIKLKVRANCAVRKAGKYLKAAALSSIFLDA